MGRGKGEFIDMHGRISLPATETEMSNDRIFVAIRRDDLTYVVEKLSDLYVAREYGPADAADEEKQTLERFFEVTSVALRSQ